MTTDTDSSWRCWLNGVLDRKNEPPPVWNTMGFILASVETDKVIFEAEPCDKFINPNGVVQGGWIAAFLDASMSAIVAIRQPGRQLCTTIEIKINYVKSVTLASGVLQSHGEIIHEGGRIVAAKGMLFDKQDNLMAYATTSCLIIKAR